MSMYAWLADLVLIVHAGVIAFVIGGLVTVLVGWPLRWEWVRNRWFRGAHLAAIVCVVLQSWLGMTCPLTDLENVLRRRAGEAGYGGEGFIAYWLDELIFYRAEAWVFTLAYTAFGLVVAATLYFVPVRWRGQED